MSDAPDINTPNGKRHKPRDMDTIMLFGCTGFVGASIGTYILTVWPNIIFPDIYSLKVMAINALLGMLPSLIMGGFVTRRFGLPGATGFLGGSMASGVFFYLRIKQVLLYRGVPQAPQPEYPDSFCWLVPIAWIIVTLITIFLLIRRDEVTVDSKPLA